MPLKSYIFICRWLLSISALALLQSSCFGQVQFVDVAQQAGIDHFVNPHPFAQQRTGGAAWFDFNNDGWEDIYLTGSGLGDKLYQNNADGTFTDKSVESSIESVTSGIVTMGVATGDINRNGFEDIIITTDFSNNNLVFLNNGDGTFSEESQNLGITDVAFSLGASLADFNADGWLDLYVCNWMDNPLFETTYTDRYYINDGDGSFTDFTNQYGLLSTNRAGAACLATDFDNDGDADLAVVNDYGIVPWIEGNRLFENLGTGFNDVSAASGFSLEVFGFGIGAGDIDEDLDMDYYISAIGRNSLLINDQGSFTDIAGMSGVWSQWNVVDSVAAPIFTQGMSWGTALFDYDNDTYLDIFSSNGRLPLPEEEQQITIDESRMFRNISATGVFDDVSLEVGLDLEEDNKGCAKADFDHDGDIDLLIVTNDSVGGLDRTVLMRNEGGNAFNWGQFVLQGETSNFQGIGARIWLYANGRTFLREIDSGGGSYLSHHSKVVHFGLDDISEIDSVIVDWPSTEPQTYVGEFVNARTILFEGQGPITGNNGMDTNESHSSVKIYPVPSLDGVLNVNADLAYDRLDILDINGKVVLTTSIRGELRLEIHHLATGTYFLCAYGDDTPYQNRIIVK